MSIEVAICDRCGECFSWHGETDGIRKIKIKERGYECSPDRSFVLCPSCMAALNDWLKGDKK
nr:MAG TPA: zinc finger protein [Caudoviricetes sp.]